MYIKSYPRITISPKNAPRSHDVSTVGCKIRQMRVLFDRGRLGPPYLVRAGRLDLLPVSRAGGE